MLLLFGVAIFSTVMGTFLDILQGFQNLNSDIDETEALSKFMGLLKNFNYGKEIKAEVRAKIENELIYRWNNDRNSAIDDLDEREILYQLPVTVIDNLFTGFIFRDFVKSFRSFFRLE